MTEMIVFRCGDDGTEAADADNRQGAHRKPRKKGHQPNNQQDLPVRGRLGETNPRLDPLGKAQALLYNIRPPTHAHAGRLLLAADALHRRLPRLPPLSLIHTPPLISSTCCLSPSLCVCVSNRRNRRPRARAPSKAAAWEDDDAAAISLALTRYAQRLVAT
jgi:hypothetical protein